MKYKLWFTGVSQLLCFLLFIRQGFCQKFLMRRPRQQQQKMPDWSNLTAYLENSLTSALETFLNEREYNITAAAEKEKDNVSDIICYLAVMLGMFAFIIVAILVSTVKSKRQEHSNDPYHQYIKEGWTAEQSEIISNFAAK